ncbi:hypothetical protein EZV62_003287 [Acer yangbiense]|uniref:Integrase catalytic domain-containing protein n=1 Tax=Acer yangbiense TaxID=1000413 RepID=A0A5C7II09_9ROSI|nr:hypothetical protein EZV62_003287 [Acer yangbiense]
MVWDSSLFTSLDRNDRTKIKLGNGEMVQATGKGTISVHTSKGPKLISDVLLIPELDQNLLSVAQLLKKGYTCLFKDNCCIISNSCGVEIVKVEMVDKSFPFNMDQVNFSTLVSKHNDFVQWNKNYSHCNMDALKKLKKNVTVEEVQATSRTCGLRDALADEKTKSLADDYEKCNLMMNEPACYKKAAQIDEKKLAMKEELMMIKRNQAQSSAKAEYIAVEATPKQAQWIKKVSTDLNYVKKKPTGLWCNNSAFSVAKNHVQHGRSKHNNVKFHAIREAEKNGEISNTIQALELENYIFGMNRPSIMFEDFESKSRSAHLAAVNASVWHAKLGHPTPLILQKMLTNVHFNIRFHAPSFCDSCKLGKLHRLPFPNLEITAMSPLELIYSDVWGPAPMLSTNGSRYYISFVDAFTRFTWLFPLKLKSDALEVFIKFQKSVELQFDSKIKNLHSDMGGEYIAFASYLAKQESTADSTSLMPAALPLPVQVSSSCSTHPMTTRSKNGIHKPKVFNLSCFLAEPDPTSAKVALADPTWYKEIDTRIS